MSDQMTTEEAIAIVSERAIWAAAQELNWADYSDVGEHDWDRVLEEIDRRVEEGDLELYDAAYAHLVARAEKTA